MSEKLFDDYFTMKTSRNIKGSQFQCPEVRQKSSKKHEAEKHPWQGTSGTGNKEKQSVYGLCDKSTPIFLDNMPVQEVE